MVDEEAEAEAEAEVEEAGKFSIIETNTKRHNERVVFGMLKLRR